VEQGGDQLHLHALAQGKLAHHDIELVAHGEKIDEFVECLPVLVGGQPVNVAQQQKRFDGGQIPPELVLLAEHEGEDAAVGIFALGGIESGDPRRAARGIDQA
jgi:hypothetical protein